MPTVLEKLTYLLRSQGTRGLVAAVRRRLDAPATARLAKCSEECSRLLAGRAGIEIGGPSPIVFGREGCLPLYRVVGRLDNCNFSRTTLWEGAIQEGTTFRFDEEHAPGRQYIAEATDLGTLPSESYDFVLSSHTLEHIANPLQAMFEWKRLLREKGILVLVVPHKDGSFDHRRALTPFEHLLDDFQRGTTEEDLTHLPEILMLHDFSQDPGAGDFAAFKERAEQNLQHRCLHHHTFDTLLVAQMVDYVGMQIRIVEALHPCHIIVVGEKLPAGEAPQNRSFLDPGSLYYRQSIFVSDRRAAASRRGRARGDL